MEYIIDGKKVDKTTLIKKVEDSLAKGYGFNLNSIMDEECPTDICGFKYETISFSSFSE